MLYLTQGLLETLLRFARERDPDATTVPLAVTKAADIPEADLPDETKVFTHFYMPDEGNAVNAVFGVELGIPAGQTPGVFISHPRGHLEVTKEDEMREIIFVAVPPWEESDVRAFGRDGQVREFTVLDVEPPEEHLQEL